VGSGAVEHRDGPRPVGPQLIVAVGRQGAIGRDGDLPWHAPEDLAHFRRETDGHSLVVGRITWESIGRPLPGRRMIVVSTHRLALPDGVRAATTPDEALDLALSDDPSPFVGGGATIYRALLPRVLTIHRTVVDVDVPGADTRFEDLDARTWAVVESRRGLDPRLTFETLVRIPTHDR